MPTGRTSCWADTTTATKIYKKGKKGGKGEKEKKKKDTPANFETLSLQDRV